MRFVRLRNNDEPILVNVAQIVTVEPNPDDDGCSLTTTAHPEGFSVDNSFEAVVDLLLMAVDQ